MVLIANFRGGPSKIFKSSWYPGYQLLFLSGGPFGFPEKQLVLINLFRVIGPRLQKGQPRTLVVRLSVTDYLGNRLMKFSEIWYVGAF